MIKFAKGALVSAVAVVALGGMAYAQLPPKLTPAEAKCQAAVSKAGAKFVGSKSKCAAKCIAGANKVPPVNPYSDCFAPYGGATATCIASPIKSAEQAFGAAIKKACDSGTTPTAECPNCYNPSKDCSSSGYATDQVQNIEGQVDSFGPGVYCEQPGATAAQTKCEQSTAKALVKQVGTIDKCYDKCFANSRKGLGPESACVPPASDPATVTCVSGGDGKTIAGINKACGGECISGTCSPSGLTCTQNSDCGDQTLKPSCTNPNDYPTGSTWTNLVDIAITGNVQSNSGKNGTYCDSPSGAFLE